MADGTSASSAPPPAGRRASTATSTCSSIGEAAKHVDDELRTAAPAVPWSGYTGLRDVIAHQYFRRQKQIIDDTVRKDLSTLKSAIEALLS